MQISGSSQQKGPGQNRVLRPPHALVASITAATLVFGTLFVAVPGQADEPIESGYAQLEEVVTEANDSQASPDGGSGETESSGGESENNPDPEITPEPTDSPSVDASPESPTPSQPESGESDSELSPEPDPSTSPDIEALEVESAADRFAVSISVDAAEYQPGQKVTVTGDGWSDKDPVVITLKPGGDSQFPADIAVSKDSAFTFSFTLPWKATGSYELTATQKRKSSNRTASASFSVKQLDKPILDARIDDTGSSVQVTGSGWNPDEFVSITTGNAATKAVASKSQTPVAGDGTIKMNVELPQERGADIELVGTGDLTGRTAAVVLGAGPAAVITIRKAGSRTSTSASSPLDGAVFKIYDVGSSTTRTIPSGATPDYSCTTGVGNAPGGDANASGECSVEVSWASGTSRRFLVVEQSAPSGWSLLPAFATDDSGTDPYTFNVRLQNGDAEIVPNIGSEQWANRLANPDWPGICGLDIALLFDESTSISNSEWTQMKSAAGSFVQALQGTPSRVAQFSFSTTALTGKYVPLASVQSASDANALISQINGKSQSGGFTNWDEGLFQVAQATESYDAVLVLTDGDPTVWGTETSGDVRLVTVQEAVHSANAIKTKGARVVGVGIGLSGSSEKNLAGISGPTVGSDYYLPAGFVDLDDALKEIASALCGGTVLIEKQLGSSIPGSTNSDSNGWPFSSEITANGADTTTVATPSNTMTGMLNDKNGQLQFKYVGGEWPKSVRITELTNPDAPGFSLENIQCSGNNLSPGSVSVSGNAVTISRIDIDETVSCIFLNSRDSASLRVLKDVSNSAGAVLPTTFDIDYRCVIGDTETKVGSLDVPAGAAGVVVAGVPTGSTCTITEQALTPIPGFTWSPVSYDPRSAVVDEAGAVFAVKALNTITRNTGSLQLVKALSGGPDGFTGPFTIEYACALSDASAITGSRSIDAGASATVTGIPSGYECVVSEPMLPEAPTGYSFGAPSFTPTSGKVVIGEDSTSTAITQNSLTRNQGNLRISKSLTGTPAGYDPDFDVSYVCTLEGEDDISGTTTVGNGGTVEVPSEGGIPTGYECTVAEGALPALPAGYVWNAPAYSNNQASTPGNVVTIVDNTVPGGDQEGPEDRVATVSIANSATLSAVPVTPASAGGAGALNVSKTLVGGPAGFAPSFSIGWTCAGLTGSVSGVLSLSPGDDATVFSVPNGYACTVSENDLPGAPTGFTWAQPQIVGSPTPVISGNSTVVVNVINTLVAEGVAPVEPASPVQPASPEVPVQPASPVGPAGLPTSVPAGGGALMDLATSLPMWLYLAVVMGVAALVGGLALRTSGRRP